MPYEGVADDRHAAAGAERDVAVLRIEREDTRLPLDALELQQVLRGDAVELPGDKVDGGRVGPVALPLIEGGADQPAFRNEVLERRCLRRSDTRYRGKRRPPIACRHHTGRHRRERLCEVSAIDPQQALRQCFTGGSTPGRGALYATPVAFASAFSSMLAGGGL